jgi:hypothetical protein
MRKKLAVLAVGLAACVSAMPAQAAVDQGGGAAPTRGASASEQGFDWHRDQGPCLTCPASARDVPVQVVELTTRGRGPDWTRVGIGASLGGLALLALGLAVAVTRSRLQQPGGLVGSGEETVQTKLERRTRHA